MLSHNLNLRIVDEDDNTIKNPILLESIYSEFVGKRIIRKGIILDTKIELRLKWERKPITKIQNKFIGDLFICSVYSDQVLYAITKFVLNEIEEKLKNFTENKNWKIVFHISKLLEIADKNCVFMID